MDNDGGVGVPGDEICAPFGWCQVSDLNNGRLDLFLMKTSLEGVLERGSVLIGGRGEM